MVTESDDHQDQDASEESGGSYPWRNDEQGSQSDSTDPMEKSTADTPPTLRDQEENPQQEPHLDSSTQYATSEESTISTNDPPEHVYDDYEEDSSTQETDGSKPIWVQVLLFIVHGAERIYHFKFLGLQKIVPWLTGTTGKKKGVSGHFYPDHLVRDDETVMYSARPSRWYAPFGYILGFVLIVLSVVVTLAVPLGFGQSLLDAVSPSFWQPQIPAKWWYFPLAMIVFAIALITKSMLQRASTWHVVTDKRVLYRKNILSPTRKRIKYEDINSLDNRVPFPDRIFGIGYIDIWTASTGGKELVMHGVKNSAKKTKMIDELQNEHTKKIRSQMGGASQHDVDQPQSTRSEPHGTGR